MLRCVYTCEPNLYATAREPFVYRSWQSFLQRTFHEPSESWAWLKQTAVKFQALASMSSREENLAVVVVSCAALIMASLNNKKRKTRRWWRTELYKKTVWVGTDGGHEVPVHLWAVQKFYENVAYWFRECTEQNSIQNFQRGNIIRKMLTNSSTNKILPWRRPNLNWASLCVRRKNRLSADPYERFFRRSEPRLDYTNLDHERLHYGLARKCIRTLTSQRLQDFLEMAGLLLPLSCC
jgi:hypothetical protein